MRRLRALHAHVPYTTKVSYHRKPSFKCGSSQGEEVDFVGFEAHGKMYFRVTMGESSKRGRAYYESERQQDDYGLHIQSVAS
jgi:hypothetical protein